MADKVFRRTGSTFSSDSSIWFRQNNAGQIVRDEFFGFVALPPGISQISSFTGSPTIIENVTFDGVLGQSFIWNGTGSFVPVDGIPIYYLVVAGGGSGGAVLNFERAGGGGAGGVVGGQTTHFFLSTASTYNISVGLGGIATTTGRGVGTNGGNSSISGTNAPSAAIGGGGGGAQNAPPDGAPGDGGSGGGAIFSFDSGTGTAGQGNRGGQSTVVFGNGAGGGGGAGAPGNDFPNNGQSAGGAGILSSITGTPTYYGGGGGALYDASIQLSGTSGGLGGGGSGSGATKSARSGVNGTGGGGAGGRVESDGGVGAGNGGNGVVIIFVPYASATNGITFEGFGSGTQVGAGDLIVNYPAIVNANDLLIGVAGVVSTTTLFAPESGWTEIGQHLNGSTQGTFALRIADGTEDGGTTTWPCASTQDKFGLIARYSGVNPDDLVDSLSDFTSDSAEPYEVSITTLTNDVTVILMMSIDGSGAVSELDATFTGTGGITFRASTYLNGDLVLVGDGYFPTPGTYTVGFTSDATGNDTRAASLFALGIKPAAGAPLTDGYIKVWTGTEWALKPVKVWTGTAWEIKPVKYYNGATWVTT